MRVWLYQHLSNSPEWVALMGDRFFQGESAASTTLEKPFAFYTMGNHTDDGFSETRRPIRQFFTIYLHDVGNDYTRIDEAIILLKKLLQNASSKEANVTTVNFLEASTDLDDETFGTIMRYARFQAIIDPGENT